MLSILNTKFGTSFNHSDIWTSRTTAYNQYNYLKSHIMTFDEILSNESNSNKLIKKDGANEKIDNYLRLDESIERMCIEEIIEYYKKEI